MVVYTIIELMRLTRIELCDLAAKITNRLPDYPETSQEYTNGRYTLRNIRKVLARGSRLAPLRRHKTHNCL